MNTAPLKKYGPQARRDFLSGVSDRAAKIGLSCNGQHEPIEVRGDFAIMGGRSYPRVFASQRKKLEDKIKKSSFQTVIEEAAYTWFNRFMAIRYMEVQGFLEHGFRVFSHPQGKPMPEILEQAQHVTLPGINPEKILELKLDGSKDDQLYRLLLVGQCRSLHQAMPFLFESIDDATELLLPDNLLASDSLVRKLSSAINEECWLHIETVGWLYQFYISEEKDRIDGELSSKGFRGVKRLTVLSEDIPAKTQLFTPRWIVRYMLQNSLGRLWMEINPESALSGKMEFFDTPAEQTSESQAKLDHLAAALRLKHTTPETITFLDPCAGSGHVLVEAYDLFKAMYEERGYSKREIPHLILAKNLFGLEIDDRAAQIAGFALMMKGRSDDRAFLENPPKINVMAIQTSERLDINLVTTAIAGGAFSIGVQESMAQPIESIPFAEPTQAPLARRTTPAPEPRGQLEKQFGMLIEAFAEAKTFGSLIRIPSSLDIKFIADTLQANHDAARGYGISQDLQVLIEQAIILNRKFDVMVTNPPYLGGSSMSSELKDFAKRRYPNTKAGLDAMFIERGFDFVSKSGYLALVTMHSWMFLSSYDAFRKDVIENRTLSAMAHLGAHAFREIGGEVVQTVETIFRNEKIPEHRGVFHRLVDGNDTEKEEVLRDQSKRFDKARQSELRSIDGWPIAYWISQKVRVLFRTGVPLEQLLEWRAGITTGENDRFIRRWYEVRRDSIMIGASSKEELWSSPDRIWVPIKKGGEFRKWYGNLLDVIRFDPKTYAQLKAQGNRCASEERYFLPSITLTAIGSATGMGFRYAPRGSIFTTGAHCGFASEEDILFCLGYLNSVLPPVLFGAINPTVNANPGDLSKLPVPQRAVESELIRNTVRELVDLSKLLWDDAEVSLEFKVHPCFRHQYPTLEQTFASWLAEHEARAKRIAVLEDELDRLFVEAADLLEEVSLVEHDHSLPALSESAARARFVETLISFYVGSLFGRWNDNMDSGAAADIIPILGSEWFPQDDVAVRFANFLKTQWPSGGEEDLAFVAESLDKKTSASPIESIRRYFSTRFFPDHLKVYKNRPIYWHFKSGPEGAFQALTYMHEYNFGTLSRIRMDYVLPLQQRMSARVAQLDGDIEATPTMSERKRREKEREKLNKQIAELRTYDEKLRHYADLRIELDLNDGVAANYAKFGDLLAESKAITGDKDE